MDKVTRLLLILAGFVLSILAMPRPDGFDDEGEMSVPRAPKIQGPDVINVSYKNHTEVENLECLIEGSPTPTVIWSKDGQEIQGTADLYNMTYDVTDGKAKLWFVESAKRDEKYVIGNFSCIAANFLGRVQKTFVIQVTVNNVSTTDSANSTENIISTASSGDGDSDYNTTSSPINDTKTNPSTVANTNSTSSVISSTSVAPNVTEPVTTGELSSTSPAIVSNGTQTKNGS